MNIKIRQFIESDIFDYPQLTDILSGYGNVRAKIGRLLASGEIIRIKKGIYTFPEYLRHSPLNPCMIANMLYGPSYVSCDYALSYYGLIPERVELVTSMTTGRSRIFSTPIANFAYFQRNAADYSAGIECIETPGGSFLMASKEKAIYDKTLTDKRFDGNNIREYLLEDLRIDENALSGLNPGILCALNASSTGRQKKLVWFLEENYT